MIQRPRILIVDDSPGNIKLLMEILGKGYVISAATSGPDALRAAITRPPNLILLDVVMPGMDGYELCRRLKSEKATQDIPVIFVTVQNSPEDEVLGLSLGAVDFISKPLNPPVVKARVKTHLEKKRAIAASVAKNAFLATMSHEIRTPLNVMLGIGTLLEETVLTEEQRQLLVTFNHAGESLLALVNDILDFSKIEAGQLDLQSVTFNIIKTISDTVDIFSSSAQAKGLKLSCSFGEGVPEYVIGDSGRLRQIIVNLVGNSVKFTSSGEVRVSVAEKIPGWIVLQVLDTGVGISESQRQTIFQPFHQANPTISSHFGGTGLGLAICEQLIGKMGGTLTLESEVDQGSIFTVQLPLQPSQSLQEVVAKKQEEGGKDQLPVARKTLSILLAEDSEDNVLLIKAFLRKTPHSLAVASDGVNAVECYRHRKYDLILMDIQMPILDGLSATRQIRDWEKENSLPAATVVVITAHALQDMMDHAYEAGCDYYLTKPIKKERLLEVVDRVAADLPLASQRGASSE